MSSESPEERIAAYKASITRLTQANAGLRAEQKRMKWVAAATVILALGGYLWMGVYTGIFVLIIGGAIFFIGHYVVFMHIHENKLTIKSARQTIASLGAPPTT
jgi:fatty acid desaturase